MLIINVSHLSGLSRMSTVSRPIRKAPVAVIPTARQRRPPLGFLARKARGVTDVISISRANINMRGTKIHATKTHGLTCATRASTSSFRSDSEVR